MARVAKPEEVAAKRNAILDSAKRLVFSKGYEQMSVQDVLADLQISGGAFHHYFDSRGALLEALIERIQQESGRPLEAVVNRHELSAVQKLQNYLDALDRLRVERKQDVVMALRVWYTDGNAIVRERVGDAILRHRGPLMAEIVRQGLREGVFTATFPQQAGEIVTALLQAMGDAIARLLLSNPMDGQRILSIQGAYMEAIERVLGTTPHVLKRATGADLAPWITAIEER